MDIQLVRIKQCELKSAWIMQKIGFMDIFLKYFDFINPVFNTYRNFTKYFKKCDMYWILADEQRVGQIWINVKENCALLARIFVLKKYRNIGIAQCTIAQAEKLYPKHNVWRLDTIKQEKANCHLYEKLGYIPTGAEKRINK